MNNNSKQGQESPENIQHLKKEINVLRTKLKQKGKEVENLKTSFLSNVSHEIRTPMNAIMGFSSLLKDNSLTEEERVIFIEGINKSSANLLKLIENIIQTAKLEADTMIINESECFVDDMMKELLNEHLEEKRTLGKDQIELRINRGNDKKKVKTMTDPRKLKTILSQLIENAIKFTEKGSVEFGYQITNNDELTFHVKDTGIGIPSAKMDHIYDRFCQAEDTHTKKYSGLGIGLTISKHLAGMLGGRIEIHSAEGSGTEVYLSLPYKPVYYKISENLVQVFSKQAVTFSNQVPISHNFYPSREEKVREFALYSRENNPGLTTN